MDKFQNILNKTTDQIPAALSIQFKNYVGILRNWKDSSSHGIETEISEAKTHEAIEWIISLFSFTTDNWNCW
jgi:hypothetical protein